MATVGGAQATKNILERAAKKTVDGSGMSGADLEQAKLANMANVAQAGAPGGGRLTQMAATSTFEVEQVD